MILVTFTKVILMIVLAAVLGSGRLELFCYQCTFVSKRVFIAQQGSPFKLLM